MEIFDLLKFCIDNLKRRKVRTLLTVIGVVVGTASIVVMVSLGVGIQRAQEEMLQGYGDLSIINVYNWGGRTEDGKELPPLDDAVVKTINEFEGVKIATPIYRSQNLQARTYAGSGRRYEGYAYSILGMSSEALKELGFELESGDWAKSANGKGTKIQMVAGAFYAFDFRDTKVRDDKAYRWAEQDEEGNLLQKPFFDPLKTKITLVTDKTTETSKQVEREITVTGIMKPDNSKGYESLYGAIMDIKDLKALEAEYMKANNIRLSASEQKKQGYQEVRVKVADFKLTDTIEEEIKKLGYQTQSLSSMRKEMNKQTQLIQLVLGGIGAVSLIVAAIGIVNTMTMAIYERTKEIGVMKVLGCELKDIFKIFIIEAALIGFIGGIAGIALSYGLSTVVNMVAGGGLIGMPGTKISVIPLWLNLLGMGFATGVGLISGILPSRRAVKISALEAIRHE